MPIISTHFPSGEAGFFRAPVLLSGPTEAILIDGGFTLTDGRKVAAAIKATGKRLDTVYVSQGDPDYYFSLAPIRDAFPEARVIAAATTVEAIRASVQKKLDVWGPKLKENGPQSLEDVVIPQASQASKLVLDGEQIEIVQLAGHGNPRYLWIPSLRAIVGGVLVFSGVHVWTADTATVEARQGWIRALDGMAAREPSLVIPGHMAENAATDASAIAYTRDYLVAFDEELARASNSAALVAAMNKRYPQARMGIALDIGAKVATGEMKWG